MREKVALDVITDGSMSKEAWTPLHLAAGVGNYMANRRGGNAPGQGPGQTRGQALKNTMLWDKNMSTGGNILGHITGGLSTAGSRMLGTYDHSKQRAANQGAMQTAGPGPAQGGMPQKQASVRDKEAVMGKVIGGAMQMGGKLMGGAGKMLGNWGSSAAAKGGSGMLRGAIGHKMRAGAVGAGRMGMNLARSQGFNQAANVGTAAAVAGAGGAMMAGGGSNRGGQTPQGGPQNQQGY